MGLRVKGVYIVPILSRKVQVYVPITLLPDTRLYSIFLDVFSLCVVFRSRDGKQKMGTVSFR